MPKLYWRKAEGDEMMDEQTHSLTDEMIDEQLTDEMMDQQTHSLTDETTDEQPCPTSHENTYVQDGAQTCDTYVNVLN